MTKINDTLTNTAVEQRRDITHMYTYLNWSCVLGCNYVLWIQRQIQNILVMCQKKMFSGLKAPFIFSFSISRVIRDVSLLKPCFIIQTKRQMCLQHSVLQLLAFRCL